MQLAKHNWKKARTGAAYTKPSENGNGYRCKRGGYKTHAEYEQQLSSRASNPQDPINHN